MQRCIELAKNSLGNSTPNPAVGCVIVYDEKIIGEGYTSEYGGPHAEVNAIESVADKSVLSNCSLYVSLEPCSHFGKTPPCTDLIIKYRIPKIYIGTLDSNKLVSGNGINKLKECGCQVTTGVLESECRELNKRFFTNQEQSRPYIILKWAQSKDGFIAPVKKRDSKPYWISNRYSRQLTHKWRSEEDGILVGTNTILDDNPSLNTREWYGKNPIKIIIDRSDKITENYSVISETILTYVLGDELTNVDLNKKNIQKISIDWEQSGNIAKQICEKLYAKEITSVIIEGGTKTLQTFIDENLWDEARVFTGDIILNDGVNAPKLKKPFSDQKIIITDRLKFYKNHQF